ncbi:MAG: MFS transporter [Opitutaceae bacterium]|nr:MFS transporter [Opitutaceae bacterium]
MTIATSPAPPVAKPLSLGVIFLTLIIDLVGFSIIFPLFPAMLDYYLGREGHAGLLGWLLGQVEAFAALAGADHRFTPVLFGGLLGSLYSFLQFLTAPAWGRLSDRIGRRPVLLLSVAGTAVSYLLWFFAGSFWLLLVARLAGGVMSGNLAVATAAVADVTSRENRARGMGLIGVAFGLGFIIGPGLGGLASAYDFPSRHPHLAGYGVNPFSTAALIAFLCCLGNLGWIYGRFRETLTPAARAAAAATPRVRHPLKALFAIVDGRVRRANLLYYFFALSFSAVEFSLTFVAAERFAYTPRQMTAIFLFLGAGSIVTQGMLVRRLVPRLGERRVLLAGLGFMLAALFTLGFATTQPVFYAGLVALSLGSGFTNATISALISLYSGAGEQGQVLGVFRSLGSLARAVGPIGGGLFYWWLGSQFLYALGGALLLAPLALGLRLPQPEK